MDRKNAGICQIIIDLAHNFGALAVTKGLECADDVRALHRMGYVLAPPMPKAVLLALLRQGVPHRQAC